MGSKVGWSGGARWTDGPIVLLGASYLAGWKLDQVGGRPVINRGIPGDQTHEYLDRFDRDVLAAQPRAVVIWGVDNDVIRAPGGDADAARTRVEDNLELLVDRAWQDGIEPVLVTDLTLRPPDSWRERVAALAGALRGKEGYQHRINRHVMALNVAIRRLAQRTATHLLDLHPITSGRRGVRVRGFSKPDGSHLTDAGYAAIDAYARPRLEAWFPPPVDTAVPAAASARRPTVIPFPVQIARAARRA